MPTTPVDIVNRALDECGIPAIGDLSDGSPAALAAERIYDSTLRQVFAAAYWNFARKQQQLVLVGDLYGQYSANQNIPAPWAYMYEWPSDSIHARWVIRSSEQANVNVPIFGTSGPPAVGSSGGWNSPVPFLVASAPLPNDPASEWDQIEGHDPEQTRVILTNQLNAVHIYTGILQYPDAWDPLFEQTVVSVIASRLAMPLIEDKKFARVVRSDNIQIARQALDAARVRDGDEGWTVNDHTPDWIRARTSYGGWGGPGVLCYPWASIPGVEDAGGSF